MAALTTEKTSEVEVEHKEGQVTPPSQENVYFDQKTEKKLIRRIDYRLLPILGALYSIALIDRVNVLMSFFSKLSRLPLIVFRSLLRVSRVWTVISSSMSVTDTRLPLSPFSHHICSSRCPRTSFSARSGPRIGSPSSHLHGELSCSGKVSQRTTMPLPDVEHYWVFLKLDCESLGSI